MGRISNLPATPDSQPSLPHVLVSDCYVQGTRPALAGHGDVSRAPGVAAPGHPSQRSHCPRAAWDVHSLLLHILGMSLVGHPDGLGEIPEHVRVAQVQRLGDVVLQDPRELRRGEACQMPANSLPSPACCRVFKP